MCDLNLVRNKKICNRTCLRTPLPTHTREIICGRRGLFFPRDKRKAKVHKRNEITLPLWTYPTWFCTTNRCFFSRLRSDMISRMEVAESPKTSNIRIFEVMFNNFSSYQAYIDRTEPIPPPRAHFYDSTLYSLNF